jgi:small-conductance mechanosensitive channel
LRRVSELGERARKWAEERGDTLSLRILQFELLRPEMLQSTAVIAATLCTWFVRIGVVYAWLAVTLSLFEATRGYTGKLATLVLSPVSDLASRLAATLPVMVVAIVAAIATWVVVRFVGLLFASVARRETHLAWVPSELALPTSVLLRVAIVVSAMAFVAPAVTGAPEGSVARTGMLALLAIALAAVPVLASAIVGAVYLFGRRLPVGMQISVGDQRGRLLQVTFLELKLVTERGDDLHIPSLYLLRAPVTVLGSTASGRLTLTVETDKPTSEVTLLILDVAAKFASNSQLSLVAFDGSRRQFELRGSFHSSVASALLTTLFEELSATGIRVTSGRSETALGEAGSHA